MRALVGAGTPKGAAEGRNAPLFWIQTPDFSAIILVAVSETVEGAEFGVFAVAVQASGL